MRQILIERARRRGALKRSGRNVSLESVTIAGAEPEPPWDLVDGALARLREIDPTLGLVFEVHYFAGVPLSDLAAHLGRSERTVKRYWRAARAWMSDQVRAELATRMG
jgi:DNA-directed RNA polymerase specialized sigma24 family protein